MEYAQPLQAALHCVTPAMLMYLGEESGAVELLRLASATGVQLRRRDPVSLAQLPPIFLRMDQHINTLSTGAENQTRRYRMALLGYRYGILDQEHREILSFHWHPGQRSHERDPHLHIGLAVVDSNAPDLGKTFSRLHIPTGHVSLARVVRMLITEFDVMPNRQDWEATLGRLLAEA